MVTTTAMAAVKRKFFHNTRMPRLSARAWWTEESIIWLKEVTHRITTPRRIRASRPISPGATLRMSPMRRLLNLVKLCPPRVLRKMPRATAAEEKTLMAVSLAMWVFCRMRVNSRAMTTAKTTAAPHRLCQAAQGPDGHAGEGGVPQGVGEEGHAALHHHGGQQAEEGGDHQHRQQGVFHEEHGVRGGPLKGQPGDQPVPEGHCSAPPFSPKSRWNTERNSGEASTAPGGPMRRISCWSRITLSA